MGKAASKLRIVMRPVKNFNVEERALKSISKEKRDAAPPLPNMKEIMKSIRSDPELLNRGKFSEAEMKNLSQVYIKSSGQNPIIRTKPTQHLPEDRRTPVENVFGMEEPLIIKKGGITLRQTLEILDKHQKNKEKHGPTELAREYELEVPVTMNILNYFRSFQLYTPPKPDAELTEAEKFKRLIAKPFVFDKPKIKSS